MAIKLPKLSVIKKKFELLLRRQEIDATLYGKHKNDKLITATGKKIKVRQYIAALARNLSSVNDASYDDNRQVLITAYNSGAYKTALKRVTDDYNFIVKQLRVVYKKQLKTQKDA